MWFNLGRYFQFGPILKKCSKSLFLNFLTYSRHPQNSASHSKVESQKNRRVNISTTRCNAKPNKNNKCCRLNCSPEKQQKSQLLL